MFYRSVFHLKKFRYLSALYLHSLIRFFAISLFSIFSSLYIFQTLQSNGFTVEHALALTAFYLSSIFIVQLPFIYISLLVIGKKGLKFSVLIGNIFLILYFIFLYLASFDLNFLFISSVLGGAEISFYWVAYHMLFTELTDDKKQGEEVALHTLISLIVSLGGPAFGGLIITYLGYQSLFLVMIILVFLAKLPLKYLPKQDDQIQVDLKVVKEYLLKTNYKSYLALASFRSKDLIELNFWPIFIFPILSGFVGLGFTGSLISLASVFATLITGYLVDRFGFSKLIKMVSIFDSLTITLQTLVKSTFQVFSVSAIHSLTASSLVVTLDSEVHKNARHTSIVSAIVHRELSFALGGSLVLMLIGVLFLLNMPLVIVFILGAILTLLTQIYPKSSTEETNPSSTR